MEYINHVNGSMPLRPSRLSSTTQAIHADDHLNMIADVAPPMHVSTTFHYDEDPEKLQPAGTTAEAEHQPLTNDAHVYSRHSAPITTRFESVLQTLFHGPALSYSSGLSAFHALLTYFNPSRIAIGAGYHGCHGVLGIHQKLKPSMKKIPLEASDAEWDASGLGKGDIVHVETPLNPTGECYDIAHYARRAHACGAILTVDSTFGPPPLQNPFEHGADVIMHSGTKYLGGHSDMLCGVLVVNPRGIGIESQNGASSTDGSATNFTKSAWRTWQGLYEERVFLGAVMGSFEGWLGLRSLRTLELRLLRQAANAHVLVKLLDACFSDPGMAQQMPATVEPGLSLSARLTDADRSTVRKTVSRFTHASLQLVDPKTRPWLAKQMPHGGGPVFALWLRTSRMARCLPSKLHLFHHATSLGGVESLIEWRRMSDVSVEETLLRVSVGIEDVGDLWEDLIAGLREVAETE